MSHDGEHERHDRDAHGGLSRSREAAASESASPAATGAAGEAAIAVSPLAALLARHVLRDGEVVLLAVKPSVWFIPFVCLKFGAVVLILMIAAQIFNEQLHYHARSYHELGVLLLLGRLTIALLQWIGRLYILTDLRVIEVSGVFNAQIVECPLRKVALARLIFTFRERLFRLGSVEVIPFDESYPASVWQTVARPREVHKVVVQAIRRAKQGMPL